MTLRTVLKWLHWLSFALIAWFWLVEPEDVERLGAAALATHAGMGTILAVLTMAWFILYLRKGLTGRAGPKLPGWAKRAHPVLHKAMMWGLARRRVKWSAGRVRSTFRNQSFRRSPSLPGRGVQMAARRVRRSPRDRL